MKKILLVSLLIISVISLVGCNQKEDNCKHRRLPPGAIPLDTPKLFE